MHGEQGALICAAKIVEVVPDMDAKFYAAIPEATEDEEDMLDLAFGLTQTSRLGCQIIMTEELDGLTVTTHWEDIADLRRMFPRLTVVDNKAWVDHAAELGCPCIRIFSVRDFASGSAIHRMMYRMMPDPPRMANRTHTIRIMLMSHPV